jgi:predicted DNA binding CopG/RHH family protein
MNVKKETISLKIDPELWKEAKKNCIDKGLQYSEYVEGLIKKDLVKK